jgi:hypothetical protein
MTRLERITLICAYLAFLITASALALIWHSAAVQMFLEVLRNQP